MPESPQRLDEEIFALKIIFSRKGMDSSSGGIPSPILPDGTLLSLPIPDEGGNTAYGDIRYGGKSYQEILKELNPHGTLKMKSGNCHLDPDIIPRRVGKNCEWRPAFGQGEASLRHLKNHGIASGDIFLFFGWFRRTVLENGKLRFAGKAEDETPDRHVIFGYMEIGEIILDQDRIDREFPYHPHAFRKSGQDNALFVPKDALSLDGRIRGWGTLK